MKKNWLILQQLSETLSPFKGFQRQQIPTKGWIHTIRTSFGITLQQLADKMKMSKQSVASLEKREMDGSVSLKTLQDAANAFDLELVYVLIPKNGTLEDYVNEKARKKAEEIILRTSNSMKLEDQENAEKRIQQSIEERALDIKLNNIELLWD